MMLRRPGRPVEKLVEDSWQPLAASFIRAMRAENRSDKTLANYGYALLALQRFLSSDGNRLPAATDVSRQQVQAFLAAQLTDRKPGTAHNRYRSLRRWFGWLVEEGEIDTSPMDRVRAPNLPVQAPPVLDEAGLRRLLAACSGRDFYDRRDAALIRFLLDTGARRSEVAAMTLKDLDLDNQIVRLAGKRSKERITAFGAKTTRISTGTSGSERCIPTLQTRSRWPWVAPTRGRPPSGSGNTAP